MGKGAKFRKPKKKRYYTKKDWISLGAVLGVIAAVVAVYLFVVNYGYVREKNGVYQIAKNELAANYGTDAEKRYKMIGTVGDIDGFTLEDKSENSLIKYLSPTDESDVKSADVGGSAYQYEELADKMSGVVASQYSIDAPTPAAATIAGRAAEYITYVSPGTEDTDEADKVDDSTPAEAVAMGYLDYDDGHCVFIEIIFSGEMPETDEILALFEKIADGLSLK